MIEIRPISIYRHYQELGELLAANWAETGFPFPFEFDDVFYSHAQASGILFALAAFDGDKVIGYSTAMVGSHPFNRHVICCNSDALFVHPDYRDNTVAARLMKATEEEGQARGATMMLWHTRAGTGLAQTLERRGYIAADVVMMKEISHGH